MSRSPTARKSAALVMLLVVVALAGSALAQESTPATPTPTAVATPTPTGDGPTPAEGKIARTLTVGVIDGDAPVFDIARLGANPGDAVTLQGDFRSSEIPHNLHATEGVPDAPKTRLAPNAFHEIRFLMPESGEVTVVCDAHVASMVLTIVPTSELAASAGVSVPGLGVHFLAYWVGIIAFMFLFVVYGATFFLFKYNETPATTDHWDRAEGGKQRPGLARGANFLALVIAVVAVAAIVWFASR